MNRLNDSDPMNIVYRSRTDHKNRFEGGPNPVLQLSWNNWDDYGHKTTLAAFLHHPGGGRQLDQLKILVEGQDFTASYFEKLIEAGWDGHFPPPETSYISNPSSVTFYEEIGGLLGEASALMTAETLHDASLLTRIRDDEDALRLVALPAFNFSLKRERGSQRAFDEGWKLFAGTDSKIQDVNFGFIDRDGKVQNILFEFASESLLPHDINLLIGPNGVGKSQLLNQFVERWLQVEGPDGSGFKSAPSFGRLIAVSYSPFERLRYDTQDLKLADHTIYQYFGLRGRGTNRPTLSLDHARRAAVQSLISCARDDRRFSGIRAWSEKLATLKDVLAQAIEFDFAAIEVPATAGQESFIISAQQKSLMIDVTDVGADGKETRRRFVRVDSDTMGNLALDGLKKHANMISGVALFRDGQILEMSSGQRLFSYLVINILGSIRRNSLLIIDEPELFLHPTLETALVTMMKSILRQYDCKAIIATHSLVLVREVPRDCVHVFEPTEEGLLLKRPPFQTFGGDIQRISSYVFGDKSISKPFEHWIEEAAEAAGGRKQLLEQLQQEDLNEELLIELGDEVGLDDPAT